MSNILRHLLLFFECNCINLQRVRCLHLNRIMIWWNHEFKDLAGTLTMSRVLGSQTTSKGKDGLSILRSEVSIVANLYFSANPGISIMFPPLSLLTEYKIVSRGLQIGHLDSGSTHWNLRELLLNTRSSSIFSLYSDKVQAKGSPKRRYKNALKNTRNIYWLGHPKFS